MRLLGAAAALQQCVPHVAGDCQLRGSARFTFVLPSGSHAELLLVPCWLVGTAAHGPEMQLKARVTCWLICWFQRSA